MGNQSTLAKTRRQLEADGYSDFFYFGRKYLGLWLILLICLIAVAFYSYGPLLDPAFKPNWSEHYHCHHRGCGLVRLGVWVLTLFLTLPVWLKLATAAFFGSGGFASAVQRIIRALDGRPDVAVGPNGFYFPERTSYRSLGWNDVSRVSVVRYRTKKGINPTPHVKVYGQLPTDTPRYPIWPTAEPLVCSISPTFGFDQIAVIDSIRRHAPTTIVSEVEEFVG